MARTLEEIYHTYNRRRWVDPDPLQLLYAFEDVRDREIAALIAACLAYGRVNMIVRAVSSVLDPMAGGPRAFLESRSPAEIRRLYRGFRYRFADGRQLAGLLAGIRQILQTDGSLEACFCRMDRSDGPTVLTALGGFVRHLTRGQAPGHLLADPAGKSACKRCHLFLRWMVRQDRVDPGGWCQVSPARLIVPLDTHMHAIGRMLGFTGRKQADARAAREITAGFARYCPEDPVRYDFSLTRFGIRGDMSLDALEQRIKRS